MASEAPGCASLESEGSVRFGDATREDLQELQVAIEEMREAAKVADIKVRSCKNAEN